MHGSLSSRDADYANTIDQPNGELIVVGRTGPRDQDLAQREIEMYELDILKWAAGSDRAPKTPANSVDRRLLLFATKEHRLQGRLLSRLERAPQRWADKVLVGLLRATSSQVQERARQHNQAIREIARAYRQYSSFERPLIIIKGQSAYRLIGDASVVRWSRDLDIVCDDPAQLAKVLSSLGYADGHEPKSYSFTELRRGRVIVDIHRYYPVYTLSADFAASIDPAQNPKVWLQSVDVRINQINYSDLQERSVPLTTVDGHVAIPDPNMTALIACAHAFRDCLHLVPRKFAAARLAELCEIRELIRHPGFAAETFLEIVERFGADSAVQFIAGLLLSYFGGVTLPKRPSRSRDGQIMLGRFYNLWFSTPWSSDDLLIRGESCNMDSLVTHLGGNTVVAGTTSHRRRYTALADGKAGLMKRVIIAGESKAAAPIDLSVTWREDALCFDLSVRTPPSQDNQTVRLQFNAVDYFAWSLRGDKQITSGIPGQVNVKLADTYYELGIVIPWNGIRDVSEDSDSVSVLISASIVGVDVSDMKCTVMIPLEIVHY